MDRFLDDLLDRIEVEDHDTPQTQVKQAWGEALSTIRASMPEEYRHLLDEDSQIRKFAFTMALLSSGGTVFELALTREVCEFLVQPVPSDMGWISSRDCPGCSFPVPGYEDISSTYPRFVHHFRVCPACGGNMLNDGNIA